MDKEHLRYLLTQYFDNTISRKDCELLLAYLDELDPGYVSGLTDEILGTDRSPVTFTPERQEQVYGQLISAVREQKEGQQMPARRGAPGLFRWLRIAAVLAGGLVVCSLVLTLSRQADDLEEAPAVRVSNDILLPEGQRAILTLPDGRHMVLDSINNRSEISGIKIKRTGGGDVLYDARQAAVAGSRMLRNTFTTPKGQSHQLILPDSTRVWLNTSSSIRYPVSFSGSERRVTLTGEAYFEVAHNDASPFIVEARGSTVQVLGTHFNISAYQDAGEVRTTLLEGKVNVSKKSNSVILKPGEQAVVDQETGQIAQLQADSLGVIAWKNGYFRFENESIESIIHKISRWYDIETVHYEGEFEERFTGTFERSKGIAALFANIEKIAAVRFEIKKGSVTVMR